METIKAYTTIEQSRKLAEILPLESADMYIDSTNPYYIHTELRHIERFDSEHHPCWSLAALLEAMPKIHGLKPILDLEECSIQYSGIDLYIVASNPIDACYEMILKLQELNLL